MTDNTDLGPIWPEHTIGGWRLDGDQTSWWLYKRFGDLVAKVYATTPKTVAWTVYDPGGRTLREASRDDVEEAKTQADTWIQEHRP
jgi:hypothetical protein